MVAEYRDIVAATPHIRPHTSALLILALVVMIAMIVLGFIGFLLGVGVGA